MQNFESREDAVRVARQILAGEIDPNLGCGLIAGIGEKLNFPSEFGMFILLGHEQYGHEGLGITTESCIPDILEACRELLALQA
jgi:hypothetical protein